MFSIQHTHTHIQEDTLTHEQPHANMCTTPTRTDLGGLEEKEWSPPGHEVRVVVEADLCVVYLFFACLVVSPDLGEIVSLSLWSRSVPQVSLVMLTRLVVAE